MEGMWVRSLGWEDPLEEEMATHSSIFAWKFHGQKSLAGYSPWGCKTVRHNEKAHTHTHTQTHTQGDLQRVLVSGTQQSDAVIRKCVGARLQGCVRLFVTSWIAALQASLSLTTS